MENHYRTLLTHFAAAAGLSLAFGCAPSETPTEAPSDLRAVDVPADFTFATTRGVQVEVVAAATALPEGQGAVEVRRANGSVVYRGPVRAGQAVALSVSVPTAENDLQVKLLDGAEGQLAQARIVDGAARYTFE